MSKETWNVAQVVEELGCSRSWVYHLYNSGELTGFRLGKIKGLRIYKASVDALKERQVSLP